METVALIGGKSGELIDPHIKSEVVWRISGRTLTREETLSSSESISFRRWWLAVPTNASRSKVAFNKGQRIDSFESNSGMFNVSAKADWKFEVSLFAPGNAGSEEARASPYRCI